MPRRCTVCEHPARAAIDRALVGGSGSNRRIASHYGLVETSVRRHAARHLHLALARAHEAQEMARADDLLGQMRHLQARALAILTAAEGKGDLRTALGAIREARANLELLARIVGELTAHETGGAGAVLTPDVHAAWRGLEQRVLAALAPYPEARARVAGALTSGEAIGEAGNGDGRG